MAFDFITLRGTFFDSAHVMRKADKMKRRALSKFGAFVRQKARSSIRRVKKPSQPGKPPHTQKGTLKLIFFSWDERTGTVVVGPILAQAKGGGGKVPRLHEIGGQRTNQKPAPGAFPGATSLRQKESFMRKVRDGTITPRKREKIKFLATYPARAYMNPAMEAELPKFAALFKGAFN